MRDNLRHISWQVGESVVDIAKILALGIVRLHQHRAGLLEIRSETARKTARPDLEQSREMRLSVTRG